MIRNREKIRRDRIAFFLRQLRISADSQLLRERRSRLVFGRVETNGTLFKSDFPIYRSYPGGFRNERDLNEMQGQERSKRLQISSLGILADGAREFLLVWTYSRILADKFDHFARPGSDRFRRRCELDAEGDESATRRRIYRSRLIHKKRSSKSLLSRKWGTEFRAGVLQFHIITLPDFIRVNA